MKRMVSVWKELQGRVRAERLAKWLEFAHLGQSVTRPLQEQHRDVHLEKVVGALYRGPPGWVQRKSKKCEPAGARKRLLGLRLRCHAAAEGFPAGDKQGVRLHAQCLAHGSPHGGLASFGESGLLPPRSI